MERRALDDFARRVRRLGARAELDAAAAELIDAFEEVGVEYAVLKGPALDRLLYPPGVHRGYGDVDVLVGPQYLDAARAALAKLGYTNATARWGIEDVGGAVHAEVWIRPNMEIGPLMIDLHWRLAGVEARGSGAWDPLARHRSQIELGGRQATVLDREGLALHLATHAAQHGAEDVHPLGDLEYALEQWGSDVWRAAAGLAVELDAMSAFAAGLRLVPAGAAMAEKLDLPATERAEWEIRNKALRPRGTFHLKEFAEARSLRERWRALRRALFPRREWIVWQYPRAARGGRWLLVARAKHLLRTPPWALRAIVYSRRARRSRP